MGLDDIPSMLGMSACGPGSRSLVVALVNLLSGQTKATYTPEQRLRLPHSKTKTELIVNWG